MKPSNSDEPSRRDFIAGSAMGLIALASGAGNSSLEAQQPAGELLYVGTYTEDKRAEGIYLVRMDTRSGELRRVGAVNVGPNPSFLAIHQNGRVLYAVNETEQRDGKATGGVSAFTIAPGTGNLARINEQSSEGAAPCYVSVDRGGRIALVANYLGGTVALLPIQADGGLAPAKHVEKHRGSGPHKNQNAPHAHSIVTDPSNRFALAADLGIDRLLVYHVDYEAGALHHIEGNDARMRPGAGPRHLTFHPTLPLVFVANELDSTVTSLRFDEANGKLSVLETLSTLPATWRGTSYVADIHVAPSGRTLYVSNRGHNSIAVFSVSSTGALEFQQAVSTGGDWPRNFSLDPSGRWLLVANQRSGSIIVFSRDQASGRLTPTSHRMAVPSPVCLRFRAHVGVAT